MHAPSASTPQLRAAHARGRRSSALLRSGVTDGVTRVWVTMLRSVFTTLYHYYISPAARGAVGATANAAVEERANRGARRVPPALDVAPKRDLIVYRAIESFDAESPRFS